MQQRVIMTTAVWTLCAWSFVGIAPSYLRSPYPPRFAPQYPEPPFGPPAFTGYDLRYPAAPYVYQYTYQYPYYVYYVVPWPRWPAGY